MYHIYIYIYFFPQIIPCYWSVSHPIVSQSASAHPPSWKSQVKRQILTGPWMEMGCTGVYMAISKFLCHMIGSHLQILAIGISNWSALGSCRDIFSHDLFGQKKITQNHALESCEHAITTQKSRWVRFGVFDVFSCLNSLSSENIIGPLVHQPYWFKIYFHTRYFWAIWPNHAFSNTDHPPGCSNPRFSQNVDCMEAVFGFQMVQFQHNDFFRCNVHMGSDHVSITTTQNKLTNHSKYFLWLSKDV